MSNIVAYRDPVSGTIIIGLGPVLMSHKVSCIKFEVLFFFSLVLGDAFQGASFNLHRPLSWIIFIRHTSIANSKLAWIIDYWLIKSTQHWLPKLWWPSINVCWPGLHASLGSHLIMGQEVEYSMWEMEATLHTQLILHTQVNFIISTRIFVLAHRRSKPTR